MENTPFVPDDVFLLVLVLLDASMLGRFACVSLRFSRKSVIGPRHSDTAPELWSLVEEAARRCIAAQTQQIQGWVSRTVGNSWTRALAEIERLTRPLCFTEHGTSIEVDGGTKAKNPEVEDVQCAMCKEHKMTQGQHYATFTCKGCVLDQNIGPVVEFGIVRADFDATEDVSPTYSYNQGERCSWIYESRGGNLSVVEDGVWEDSSKISWGGIDPDLYYTVVRRPFRSVI